MGRPAQRQEASTAYGEVLVSDSASASGDESPDDADRPAIVALCPFPPRKLKRKRSQTSRGLVQTGRQLSSRKIPRQNESEDSDEIFQAEIVRASLISIQTKFTFKFDFSFYLFEQNEIMGESKVRLVKETYTYNVKWSARQNRGK